jgi:hypothetical protein
MLIKFPTPLALVNVELIISRNILAPHSGMASYNFKQKTYMHS